MTDLACQMNNWNTYSWIFSIYFISLWRQLLHKTERRQAVWESSFPEDILMWGFAKLGRQEGKKANWSLIGLSLLWTKTVSQKKSAQWYYLIKKEVELRILCQQSAIRVVRHWNRLPRECLISGIVQDQAGWNLEQLAVVKSVLVHSKGLRAE